MLHEDKLRALILVKHALPDIKPDQPANQWRLSKTGRLHCRRLAESLSPYAPDVIVSSTEPKAEETAQIVAEYFDLAVDTLAGLREHNRENYPWTEKAIFEQNVAEFFKYPATLVMGQETADQAYARFAAAVHTVVEKYPVGNIVVVAHGTVITLYVSRALALEPFTFWRRLGLPSFVVLSHPNVDLIIVKETL